VAQHPNVQRAAARVREAYLAVQRVELPAPVDGYVARRSVQLGQRVQAGSALMSVVALNQVWVDANFKEGQLRRLRIGQPATLVADVYGKKVEFHGRIEGLGAGTGSAFALLPAQNATGNWIKVVQRVPVRIALDAQEVAKHPLRVGLSMDVDVDVADQSGKMLADAAAPNKSVHTSAFEAGNDEAQAEVERIINVNLGRPARALGGAAAPKPGDATPAAAAAAAASVVPSVVARAAQALPANRLPE
jgi:membrane fusion protein (multidrug efflux system)